MTQKVIFTIEPCFSNSNYLVGLELYLYPLHNQSFGRENVLKINPLKAGTYDHAIMNKLNDWQKFLVVSFHTLTKFIGFTSDILKHAPLFYSRENWLDILFFFCENEYFTYLKRDYYVLLSITTQEEVSSEKSKTLRLPFFEKDNQLFFVPTREQVLAGDYYNLQQNASEEMCLTKDLGYQKVLSNAHTLFQGNTLAMISYLKDIFHHENISEAKLVSTSQTYLSYFEILFSEGKPST
jgi:hypothetical protein